jgi:hypothetical protein
VIRRSGLSTDARTGSWNLLRPPDHALKVGREVALLGAGGYPVQARVRADDTVTLADNTIVTA